MHQNDIFGVCHCGGVPAFAEEMPMVIGGGALIELILASVTEAVATAAWASPATATAGFTFELSATPPAVSGETALIGG
jgi:hypothetical protein